MKHIFNRHHNKYTNRYRYMMIDKETDKLIKYFHCAANLGYCKDEPVVSPRYTNVRKDYKPYFLYNILWSIKSWYKRPSPIPIISHPIFSKLTNGILLIIISALGTIIGGIFMILIKRGIIDIGI